jgi:thiamine-monophosphate kinase
MPSEFDIIKRYFTRDTGRTDIICGVGDDAAVLDTPPGKSLVVTLDTLVEDIHFAATDSPADIGHKLLAVNLSDIAAMGATPSWATLALTLPRVNETWLRAFADGLYTLASEYGVAIVGGDTTRGPLTLSLQLAGYIEPGQALLRKGARPGDDIYVSGTLGDAGLALRSRVAGVEDLDATQRAMVQQRLYRPQPRVSLGQALVGLASSCIDISDGLLADLGHILECSDAGADIELGSLPLSDVVAGRLEVNGDWSIPLASGDDYELCFTAPPDQGEKIAALADQVGVPVCRIGAVSARQGMRCHLPDGRLYQAMLRGYEHFQNEAD